MKQVKSLRIETWMMYFTAVRPTSDSAAQSHDWGASVIRHIGYKQIRNRLDVNQNKIRSKKWRPLTTLSGFTSLIYVLFLLSYDKFMTNKSGFLHWIITLYYWCSCKWICCSDINYTSVCLRRFLTRSAWPFFSRNFFFFVALKKSPNRRFFKFKFPGYLLIA